MTDIDPQSDTSKPPLQSSHSNTNTDTHTHAHSNTQPHNISSLNLILNKDDSNISKISQINTSNISKRKELILPVKYRHLNESKLLEKIDDDIQELNLLKSKILYSLNNNNNNNDSNDSNDNDNEDSNSSPSTPHISSDCTTPEATTTPVTVTTQKNEITNETTNGVTKLSKDWRDNSHSTLLISAVKSNFRQYRQYELAYDRVKFFYKEQHEKQTVAYNIQARINFKAKIRDKMTIWDALIKLNNLLDESDPDTELSQIDHALQTAEAIRRDNKPRWFQLVGLIHDLGKLLYFYDSKGQWDVVGDTFPVGCRYSKKIIYYNFFKNNPDSKNPLYNTKFGLYSPNCGLDKVMLSWGHDEYMYHLAKEQSTLPPEGLAMIRYHSFYPWHQEGAYKYLMSDHDIKMLTAVKAFNPYDLYSKSDIKYDINDLKTYYTDLIDEFFPNKIVEF
ncbi:hypothetical protein B5S33_g3142 [[Candida] boidinii]|nr:hypothetical protein B5S33_g3142 [[Candida] boidinii]GMF99022.1 unnamed protein product [[Candida] boidinii]